MRTNYVLIDYENVQPEAMAVLSKEHFKVIVFVGANQAKVTFEVASALQQMGERAEYIKISGNGSNALDFHIAYYIGLLASKEPDAYFHIVSKDTGFDPLINHLKGKKILACRSKDVTDIPIVKASNSKSPSEKIAVIIADLKRRGAAKPRAVKTLTSTISNMFQKQLSDEELQSLLLELQTKGIVSIAGTKVSYELPA
ncbi:PIN domain-containing protein [Limnobacter sp. P1]|uniref:PIN domain-containing protein n=1 Tax=Limnobacter olei TaxID=3031298 RepID=UPI0023AF2D14|nr:PIN domain-containing protein [Limnobacter sp. P1]